jgi:hypothetical protein
MARPESRPKSWDIHMNIKFNGIILSIWLRRFRPNCGKSLESVEVFRICLIQSLLKN